MLPSISIDDDRFVGHDVWMALQEVWLVLIPQTGPGNTARQGSIRQGKFCQKGRQSRSFYHSGALWGALGSNFERQETQNGAHEDQVGPKSRPGDAKLSPSGTSEVQNGSQEVPNEAQERPRGPKLSPKDDQGGPKRCQNVFEEHVESKRSSLKKIAKVL